MISLGGTAMEEWQKKYEQHLYENYVCRITNKPCTNCAKYGCEHRQQIKK